MSNFNNSLEDIRYKPTNIGSLLAENLSADAVLPPHPPSNNLYRSWTQCRKCENCQKEHQAHLIGSLDICCECLPKSVIERPYENYNVINQNNRERIFKIVLSSFPSMYNNLNRNDKMNKSYCKATLLGILYPENSIELIRHVINNVPEEYKSTLNFWNGLKRLFGEDCFENLIPEVLVEVTELKDQFFHNLDFL